MNHHATAGVSATRTPTAHTTIRRLDNGERKLEVGAALQEGDAVHIGVSVQMRGDAESTSVGLCLTHWQVLELHSALDRAVARANRIQAGEAA